MPSLNFQEQFAWKVQAGEKMQTIRVIRKRPFVSGDRLYLFSGMRTKNCYRLGEFTCAKAQSIVIGRGTLQIASEPTITSEDELDDFARLDGFDDWEELIVWIEKAHGLPFVGQLIEWDYDEGIIDEE